MITEIGFTDNIQRACRHSRRLLPNILRKSGITVLSHRIQTDPPIRGVRIREGCAAASTAPPQVHKLQQSSSKLHAALSKSILRQSGITFLSHRIQTDPPIRRCKKLGCHPRRMCCRLDCSTTSAQAPTIFNTSKLQVALFKCILRQSGITVLSHRIQTDPPIRGVRS